MTISEITGQNIASSQYSHQKIKTKPVVLDNILEHIGNTPLVKINHIAKEEGLECDLYVKCEFFNPGGAVKDRVALRMIEEAERTGKIKPGDTIIEPTSGNTGIGLALIAAIKGYKTIITMPERMSQEKVNTMTALGAKVIRTPNDAPCESPQGHIGLAKKLNEEIKDSIILDQYANPYNPITHYDTTAEEILQALNDQVDMFVAGAGTGGTVTGIATKFKERCPNVHIVGVDPHGSIMARPDSLNDLKVCPQVEGIGGVFVPKVMDYQVIDEWYKSNDEESFLMARRLIQKEGILCGGSSGAAVAAAVKSARHLKSGQKCVVILADSIRNYMSKFLDDGWLKENVLNDNTQKCCFGNGNINTPCEDRTIGDFGLVHTPTTSNLSSCSEAIKIMRRYRLEHLPVVCPISGKLVGLIHSNDIFDKMIKKEITKCTSVSEVMAQFDESYTNFTYFGVDTPIKVLNEFLLNKECVIITQKTINESLTSVENKEYFEPLFVLNKKDLLLLLTNDDC